MKPWKWRILVALFFVVISAYFYAIAKMANKSRAPEIQPWGIPK